MALTIKNFELPDKTILNDAYLRIATINTAFTDYEHFEPLLDSNDVILSWVKRLESKAHVFVHGDEIARQNRVSPINWFEFKFDLDLTSNQNIYEQAYQKLKEIYPEGENA